MDGLAAAREISQDRQSAVLILTAFSQRDLIEQARDAGRAGLPGEAVPAHRADPGRRGGAGPLPRDAGPVRPELEPRGAAGDPQAGRPGQGPAHGRARHDRGRRLLLGAAAGHAGPQDDAGGGRARSSRASSRPTPRRSGWLARSCSSTATPSSTAPSSRSRPTSPPRRAGHQRRLRLHVDAHQHVARPPARRAGRRLRPARAHLPPRAHRHVQGQPRVGPRHPPPADGPGPPGRRVAAHPDLRGRRLRGRRRHRHAGHRGPRPRRRRHRRHRRPRQLPAGRGPARQGALQQAGRVRLRALRRGGHRRAHRRAARPLPAVRGAAGRPVRQPARRAREWGRRRRRS